ncbi:hypothetical protein RSAG8_12807, partial [Rhizoctonia solani AG-8 WAC10335]
MKESYPAFQGSTVDKRQNPKGHFYDPQIDKWWCDSGHIRLAPGSIIFSDWTLVTPRMYEPGLAKGYDSDGIDGI